MAETSCSRSQTVRKVRVWASTRSKTIKAGRMDGAAKSRRPKKNRQTKNILVFDENARLDYLTGFRKRKKERQKKAKEELEQQLKDDRKELKRQRRELLLKSQRYSGKKRQSVPEIESIVEPQVYDMEEHTVTITDISEVDLAGHGGLRLGQNQFRTDSDTEDVDGAERKEDEKEGDLLSEKKLKQSLKKLKRKHGEIDTSIHKASGSSRVKKTKFQKPRQYDKKSLKKRKENSSFRPKKKKIKHRN